MNKWMMVLQGVIVCGLLGIVLVIGYGKRDKDYIKYTSELKAASKKYMLNKKINPKINETIVIFVSDLIDGKYIKKDEDEYCIKSIIYTKGLLSDEYKYNKDCGLKTKIKEVKE